MSARASVLLIVFLPSIARALPMYALASAHTCGNCHVSPTYEDPAGWDDPELPKRKCNLSCVSCHVNPTGGALRNTSGRYFAQSTLAMFAQQERSYSDVDRDLFPQPRREVPSSQPSSQPASSWRTIPSSWADVEQGVGAGQIGGWSVLGHPLLGPSEYALWDGRYGDLLADPVLAFGGDFRLAYWTGSESFFPMQVDLDAALHPVEHLTLMATLAGRGRATGVGAVVTQDRIPFFLRNAFVMVHELPYVAYVKAGLFLPAFGTFIDDHTSFIRRYFDMDVSTSDDTVAGVEVGFAPNYPFASASVFEGLAGGQGAAVNFGWRALGWSASGHAMIKRRTLEDGGDLDAGGVAFGFAPQYWIEALPISLLGELDVGRRRDPITARAIPMQAFYAELFCTIWNGVNVRGKYDLARRELGAIDEVEQRWSLALDIAILPGLTLLPQVRVLQPPGGQSTKGDVFLQMHAWF